MHNDYFWHDAYSEYPVVGVSWEQAKAFAHWRTMYKNKYQKLKSKNDHLFNASKFKIYLFGFIFIVFLEASTKLISTNIMQNLILSILPFFLTLVIYLYYLVVLKVNKK